MNMAKGFQIKDSKYSGADNENIMDFIVQYDLVSRDFNLSHHEKRQYVHNLIRGEALRSYYAEVEPLGNNYADVIAKMQSQFNSISIQQFVKAELSGLSFQDMVDKSDCDKRKALRDLFATIEARIPLCPRDWRNESNKVDFLRNALLTEDWARHHLYSIGKGTHFRELQTQLAITLQIHEEVLVRSGNSNKSGPSASSGSKPTIFFTAPKYAKRVTKKLFTGSDQDRSCWNCWRTGHRHVRCRKPLNPAFLAARKAEFSEKEKKSRNGSKRALHELVQGLEDLLNIESTDIEAIASTYFGDKSDESSDTDYESQDSEPFKEVDPTIKVGHTFVFDEDSELDF